MVARSAIPLCEKLSTAVVAVRSVFLILRQSSRNSFLLNSSLTFLFSTTTRGRGSLDRVRGAREKRHATRSNREVRLSVALSQGKHTARRQSKGCTHRSSHDLPGTQSETYLGHAPPNSHTTRRKRMNPAAAVTAAVTHRKIV